MNEKEFIKQYVEKEKNVVKYIVIKYLRDHYIEPTCEDPKTQEKDCIGCWAQKIVEDVINN